VGLKLVFLIVFRAVSVLGLSRRESWRLIVTPGTILRWHRDIVRRR
jgi:hypothetical protein